MRIFLQIILLLALLQACRSKNHIPSGIIPQKQMQQVLWDLMRADQYLGNYVLNNDSSLNKTKESLKYYQQVFAIHKISREKFQQSFAFYREHPALFKAIMDSISLPTLAAPAKVADTPHVIRMPDTLAR